MHMRKLMITAAIVMMASFAITTWVRADDTDKDGVPNSPGDKICPHSDISPTVSNPRSGKDCGVANLFGKDGCTAMDIVAQCDTSTTDQNKNKFKNCVVTNFEARDNMCMTPNWQDDASYTKKEIATLKKCFQ